MITSNIAVSKVATTDLHNEGRQRTRRVYSAWITSIPSKVITFVAQVITVPIVYRSIGPVEFSAYAAVTAIAWILNVLNLGMGGALVTPLAQAAAHKNQQFEANIFRSALLPVIAISIVALTISLPLLLLLPLRTIFGIASTATSEEALRTAVVLACIGTVVAIPLSVVENVRQAYQELHINNVFNAFSNALVCFGLLVAARTKPTLTTFVAVTVLAPVVVRITNAGLLLHRRPYLVTLRWSTPWLHVKPLARDGFSYICAVALASALLYQWSVYYMTRSRPALESSRFAVFLQLIIIALSFGTSLTLPLWGAIADAAARADYAWTAMVVRRIRIASLAYGFFILIIFGLMANPLLHIWLHRPFHTSAGLRWLGGFYVLLAIWENVHWILALGFGAMRSASRAILWRAVVFAAFVPFAASHGTVWLMFTFCASVLAITAWYCPLQLTRDITTEHTIAPSTPPAHLQAAPESP
jgi:O-antigen/teichoic acid export membrane protein